MKRLKKRLFEDSGQHHGTVILNWVGTPEREFTWYGQAFHEAGKQLVDQLKEDPSFGPDGFPPDSFKALPIVYLYRHTMELYLKGIILAGAGVLRLRGEPALDIKDALDTHSLQSLLAKVERIFEAFGWDWDFELPAFRSLSDFRSIIGQFANVDACSYAFRYPTTKDCKSASLESGFRFNLFNFCEVLDPIYKILDGAAFGAREELQSEYEQQAEARQYEMENADCELAEYEPSEY